ncbi:huntingtin-like isoform X2 [Acanthaster planci]|uniref:Huntingtin-like isoform X2 n=1 Tax=Acanthaster planci TaxID=133434 RepID=A0A8B7XIP8_ACAPL|nr:huntingtin-like isoform X2 [Acanthaster planci]
MANVDKLARAFDALKTHQQGGTSDESGLRKKDGTLNKKERISHCSTIADGICSSSFRAVADFPKFLGIAMELFFAACDDEDSDVRLKADECLNKCIKVSMDGNLGRVQLELYKEIKKNGPSRCLRAALWRFASLAHLIRPQKCRPYVINLLPCIPKISRRQDDAIQESLTNFMQKVLPILGSFLTDTEVKNLTKVFYPNVKHPSAATRRTAASCLTLVCYHGRKPAVYFSMLVKTLLMFVIPVKEDRNIQMLLGVLLCFRHVIPHLASHKVKELGLKGSFGVTKKEEEGGVTSEQLQQIYEFLLNCTQHTDHNVVTATLETLQQLLRTTPPPLLKILLCKGGITVTTIFEEETGKAPEDTDDSAVGSQAPSLFGDSGLDEESDSLSLATSTADMPSSTSTSDTGIDSESTISMLANLANVPLLPEETGNLEPLIDESEVLLNDNQGEYSNVDIGDIEEDSVIQDTMSYLGDQMRQMLVDRLDVEVGLDARRLASSDLLKADEMDFQDDTSREDSSVKSSPTTEVKIKQGDIGHYTDDDYPVTHCVRLLSSTYLLTGYSGGVMPDRHVRISVKALALSCVGLMVGMHPRIFFAKLFNSDASETAEEDQLIRDILLYMSHNDHQLRGQTTLIIGNLIRASLVESAYDFTRWCWDTCQDYLFTDPMSLDYLVSLLSTSLKDESSVTLRSACQAIKLCLLDLCKSRHGILGLQLTHDLLELKKCSYWLVQVELLDLLSGINFKLMQFLENKQRQSTHHSYLTKLNSAQDSVLNDIVLKFLGSHDVRVRHAAAEAIVKMVPKLFYPVDYPHQDPLSALAKDQISKYVDPVIGDAVQYSQAQTTAMSEIVIFKSGPEGGRATIDSALSRVVDVIVKAMNACSSKYIKFGCCHALCQLSMTYSVIAHPSAWNCAMCQSPLVKDNSVKSSGRHRTAAGSFGSQGVPAGLEELCNGSGCGPLPLILSNLTSSLLLLDLTAHQDALHLAGNILIGIAYHSLKVITPTKPSATTQSTSAEEESWACLQNRLLVPLAAQLMQHVARVLCICAHVIEGTQPGPPKSQTTLPSLPAGPSLSPIKRRAKGKDKDTMDQGSMSPNTQAKLQADKAETAEEKKSPKSTYGAFYQLPHYMKLYEVMKSAYNNYKVTLDLCRADKFAGLLKTSLDSFSQLLEIATMNEVGKYTEELLSYLKACFTIEPTSTVLCVEQLLKALFFTNMASSAEIPSSNFPNKPGKAFRLTSNMKPGIYHDCFVTPLTQYNQSLNQLGPKMRANPEAEGGSAGLFGWVKSKIDKKSLMGRVSNKEKTSVHSYIRLFEPLVIRALKQYTITSSIPLQQQVLHLLAQLVQLRVNYCLLDSDQIFIGFVVKQFEYVEEGHVKDYDTLIPHIFHFLVLLSYERYHSKAVIAMPKIIQLCDGIMASGQQATTHAVPALKPLVHDLYVLRGSSKSDSARELDTQREVVESMLQRLIHFHQALEMFIPVLLQAHRDSEDKWKRLSRQVVDMILPLLARQQINLDCQEALDTLHHLFGVVAPSALRPVDILLKSLLLVPYETNHPTLKQRWLGMALAILNVLISQSKEETILSRLRELGLTTDLFVCPLEDERSREEDIVNANVLPAEDVLARFLMQVIGLTISRGIQNLAGSMQESQNGAFIYQELSHLLLYITHMFKSGAFRKVAVAMTSMIRNSTPSCWFTLDQLNHAFIKLSVSHPILVLQWCQILLLLNYSDQDFWSVILQTPKRQPLSKSLSSGSLDNLETNLDQTKGCPEEIIKRGGLILYCDYVCENQADAEPLTWLVVNHINEIIQLFHEPPVQDVISAIHRNSAASGLFLRAVNLRFTHLSDPCLVKLTLQCLQGIHLSQSGVLLTILIERFLNTHQLAVARLCDSIACRRVEMLLAGGLDDSTTQLSAEQLEKLDDFMNANKLTQRHPRLASLLTRFKTVILHQDTTQSPSSNIQHTDIASITPNKEWFLSVVQQGCFGQTTASARECSLLLAHLPLEDIIATMMTEDFSFPLLEDCILVGLQRTRLLHLPSHISSQTIAPNSVEASSKHKPQDAMLEAACTTLLSHIHNIIAMMPAEHTILRIDSRLDSEMTHKSHMMSLIQNVEWRARIFELASALVKYLTAMKLLAIPVPPESLNEIARLAVTCVEVTCWSLTEGSDLASSLIVTALECVGVTLQNQHIFAVIGLADNMTWACSTISCLHQIVKKMNPHRKCFSSWDMTPEQKSLLREHRTIETACQQITELLFCLHYTPTTDEHNTVCQLPQFLKKPLGNVVVSMARLPLVNSYARTPPYAYKLGWVPSPKEGSVEIPPLPMEYLKEKEVLKEFVVRANTIGWTSRQQFEETWAGLLGVFTAPVIPEEIAIEEDIEHSQSICLAVRTISSLLVDSLLTPQPGNPTNSTYQHIPRHGHRHLPFLETSLGRKLLALRWVVEKEVDAMASNKIDTSASRPISELDNMVDLFMDNLEQQPDHTQFDLARISVHGIWAINNMLPPLTDEDPEILDENTQAPKPLRSSPVRIPGNLDVHSCLMFLEGLYGQWLSPTTVPRTPLMLICETVKSILVISDVFTQRAQYEWMFDTLLDVNKNHPVEDELVTQYAVPGICKAAAVLGLEKDVAEKVSKLLEVTLRSTHLPSRVGALYGALYILESDAIEDINVFVPVVSDYVARNLHYNSHCSSLASQRHTLVMLTAAFYVIEYYYEYIKATDFTRAIMQSCISMASVSDGATSPAVYKAIMRGFERLLISGVLSVQEMEVLTKLSMDKLCMPSPLHAMSALGLLLTSMYVQKHKQTSGSSDWSDDTSRSHDPESQVMAMERISVLFDRIRKGYPSEARAVAQILPACVSDFFSPQDVMNKVIGEFLSNQQPHPQLMATVVFKVFGSLHSQGQPQGVRDWVMLSLSNFTQRTPIAMAVWSLTCFFISASANPWIRALLPHIVGRMGRLEAIDKKYFLIVARDFFLNQVTDESSKRAFMSVFQSAAASSTDPVYSQLLGCV